MLFHKLLEVNTLTHLEQLKAISILLPFLRWEEAVHFIFLKLSLITAQVAAKPPLRLCLFHSCLGHPEFWSDALHLSAQPLWCTGNSGLLARNKGHCDSKTRLQLRTVCGAGQPYQSLLTADIWQHLCFYSAEVTNILILKVSWYCQMSWVCVWGG